MQLQLWLVYMLLVFCDQGYSQQYKSVTVATNVVTSSCSGATSLASYSSNLYAACSSSSIVKYTLPSFTSTTVTSNCPGVKSVTVGLGNVYAICKTWQQGYEYAAGTWTPAAYPSCFEAYSILANASTTYYSCYSDSYGDRIYTLTKPSTTLMVLSAWFSNPVVSSMYGTYLFLTVANGYMYRFDTTLSTVPWGRESLRMDDSCFVAGNLYAHNATVAFLACADRNYISKHWSNQPTVWNAQLVSSKTSTDIGYCQTASYVITDKTDDVVYAACKGNDKVIKYQYDISSQKYVASVLVPTADGTTCRGASSLNIVNSQLYVACSTDGKILQVQENVSYQTCPAGYYCPAGSYSTIQCSQGSYCPSGSLVSNLCPANYYCPSTTIAILCSSSSYCPSGSTSPTPIIPTDVNCTNYESTRSTIGFVPPSTVGNSSIVNYKVVSSPDNVTVYGTSSSIQLTGLRNGQSYTFTVFACFSTGCGVASTPSIACIPAKVPDPPTLINATSYENSQSKITFLEPSSNGGTTILLYQVLINGTVSGFTSAVSGNIVVSGLTNGQPYALSLVAVNGAGTSLSSPNVVITPLSKPSSPAIITVSSYQNAQVTVAYNLSANNGGFSIVKYTVNLIPTNVTPVPVKQDSLNATSTSMIIKGLTNGVIYKVTIVAFNGVYTSDISSFVLATPASVPSKPLNVKATNYEDNKSTVTFSNPVGNGGVDIIGYIVISTPGYISATGTSSPIVVNGLTNGMNYTFIVIATNPAGNSTASASSSSIIPATVSSSPTDVSATSYLDKKTNVRFTYPVSNGGLNITSYYVIVSPGERILPCKSSPVVILNLVNGVSYTFKVMAANAVGNSSISVSSLPAIPAASPAAPTNVRASINEDSQSVSFDLPLSNGGIDIDFYTVTTSPGGLTFDGTTSPIVASGLLNGQSYTFTVTATNAAGTSVASVASAPVTPGFLTTPSSPTNVQATNYENSQSTVTFTAPSTNGGTPIANYTVTSYPEGKQATSNSTTIVITGLTNGVSYTFTVTATNMIGTSIASVASQTIIPASVPSVPINVQATDYENGQSTVTFNPSTSDGGIAVTNYTVTSHPDGKQATSTSTTIVIKGLTNGVSYSFSVTASNDVGTSIASTSSIAIVPATVPAAPTNVQATNFENGQSTVSFIVPSTNGGLLIANYTVTSNPDGIQATSNTTTIIIKGLTNGVSYTFTVVATNAAGTSIASVASSAITSALLSAPDAPTNIQASNYENGQSTVTFNAPINNGGASIIDYTVTSYPEGKQATSNSTTIVVKGLTNGVSYTFTVTARNVAGVSVASVASQAIIPAAVPSAPINIQATNYENGQSTVTFNVPSSNGGLLIAIYTVTSNPDGKQATSNSTTILVKGLTNGVSYTFTVTASNVVGTSIASTASMTIIPATVASTPTNVKATSYENGQSTVYFDISLSNGGTSILNYIVISNPDGKLATDITSPIVVAGLKNGVHYTFSVIATNAVGNSSASIPSSEAIPAIVPSEPTNVQATNYENGQSTVTFNIPSSNGGLSITNYTVTSFPDGKRVTSNATTVIVKGLTNGVSYTFVVAAANVIGTSISSVASASITPATIPSAPLNIKATRYENGQSIVRFDLPLSNGGIDIITYTVTSFPGGLQVNGSGPTFLITGLTNGIEYTFTVTATNAVGTSPSSLPSPSIIPATFPSPPSNLTVAHHQLGTFTVNFSYPVYNGGVPFSVFSVLVQPGNLIVQGPSSSISVTGLMTNVSHSFSATATNIANFTSLPSAVAVSTPILAVTSPSLPSAPINVTCDSHQNHSSLVQFSDTWTSIPAIDHYMVVSSPDTININGSTSPMNIVGLRNGQVYTFTVRACSAIGCSLASVASTECIPTTVPDAPSISNATINQQNRVVVSVSEPRSNGGSTILKYRVLLNGTEAVYESTDTNSIIIILLNDFKKDQWYEIRVIAINIVGKSLPSKPLIVFVPNAVSNQWTCPSGYYCPTQDLSSLTICSIGYYCPGNNTFPIQCPPGSYCPYINMSSPLLCPAGTFCSSPSTTTPTSCPVGYVCSINTTTPVLITINISSTTVSLHFTEWFCILFIIFPIAIITGTIINQFSIQMSCRFSLITLGFVSHLTVFSIITYYNHLLLYLAVVFTFLGLVLSSVYFIYYHIPVAACILLESPRNNNENTPSYSFNIILHKLKLAVKTKFGIDDNSWFIVQSFAVLFYIILIFIVYVLFLCLVIVSDLLKLLNITYPNIIKLLSKWNSDIALIENDKNKNIEYYSLSCRLLAIIQFIPQIIIQVINIISMGSMHWVGIVNIVISAVIVIVEIVARKGLCNERRSENDEDDSEVVGMVRVHLANERGIADGA